MPVGGALGFVLGGTTKHSLPLLPLIGEIAKALNWRYAFLITGLPGLAIAVLIFFIKDPGIGTFEKPVPQERFWKAVKKLLSHKTFMLVRTIPSSSLRSTPPK